MASVRLPDQQPELKSNQSELELKQAQMAYEQVLAKYPEVNPHHLRRYEITKKLECSIEKIRQPEAFKERGLLREHLDIFFGDKSLKPDDIHQDEALLALNIYVEKIAAHYDSSAKLAIISSAMRDALDEKRLQELQQKADALHSQLLKNRVMESEPYIDNFNILLGLNSWVKCLKSEHRWKSATQLIENLGQFHQKLVTQKAHPLVNFSEGSKALCKGLQLANRALAILARSYIREMDYPKKAVSAISTTFHKAAQLLNKPADKKLARELNIATRDMRRTVEGHPLFRQENKILTGLCAALAVLTGAALIATSGVTLTVAGAGLAITGVGFFGKAFWPKAQETVQLETRSREVAEAIGKIRRP